MTLYRTGKKKYSMLQEIDSETGEPTGNVKPNVPGDPDYVEPVVDETACPEGPIVNPTTTTSTTSSTTTSTTTVLPDAFRIHVAYKYVNFPGVSYQPFDVNLQVTDGGATQYFDGHVTFPIYTSGNQIVTNIPTRSSQLIDITINSIVVEANWMRVLYSKNSYPNLPSIGEVLYEGPAVALGGLAIPTNYDSNQDILVIEFSTTSAAPTTTSTTSLPPIETCDVFLNYGPNIVLYKNGAIHTLGVQPLNKSYVDIAIIGNKLYGRVGIDIDEWDINANSISFVITHSGVLQGYGPSLGSDGTYLYADIGSKIYRVTPGTWLSIQTDMGSNYGGQGDIMLIGDNYLVGSVNKNPGNISLLQSWENVTSGSTIGFESEIITNYGTALNNVFGMFQQNSKFYLLTSNGLVWEYDTVNLIATQVDNLSNYYSGNLWNGAAQRGSCGSDIYLTTTTTQGQTVTIEVESDIDSNVEVISISGNGQSSIVDFNPNIQPGETKTLNNVQGWTGDSVFGTFLQPLSDINGAIYKCELFLNNVSVSVNTFGYNYSSMMLHLSGWLNNVQGGDIIKVVISRQ